jgi:hypothetical protein
MAERTGRIVEFQYNFRAEAFSRIRINDEDVLFETSSMVYLGIIYGQTGGMAAAIGKVVRYDTETTDQGTFLKYIIVDR